MDGPDAGSGIDEGICIEPRADALVVRAGVVVEIAEVPGREEEGYELVLYLEGWGASEEAPLLFVGDTARRATACRESLMAAARPP